MFPSQRTTIHFHFIGFIGPPSKAYGINERRGTEELGDCSQYLLIIYFQRNRSVLSAEYAVNEGH